MTAKPLSRQSRELPGISFSKLRPAVGHFEEGSAFGELSKFEIESIPSRSLDSFASMA